MGCGWKPSMDKVEALITNAFDFTLCVRYFSNFTLPADFRVGDVITPVNNLPQQCQKQDSSSSASSGSLTDDSVGTASEAEKVTIRDLDKALASKDQVS